MSAEWAHEAAQLTVSGAESWAERNNCDQVDPVSSVAWGFSCCSNSSKKGVKGLTVSSVLFDWCIKRWIDVFLFGFAMLGLAEPHFNSWQNYDSVSPHSKSCLPWTQVFSWRWSKWHRMLQFYIVWQRCLLDVPYHKYHLLLVSGLPGPLRIWLTFISKELQGGLSFTAEAWQQERAVTEPSRSRPGKITPKFQWHNGQNQSGASLCPERWETLGWLGGWGRMLQRDHIPSSSVSKCDEKIQLVSDSLLNARSHLMRSV